MGCNILLTRLNDEKQTIENGDVKSPLQDPTPNGADWAGAEHESPAAFAPPSIDLSFEKALMARILVKWGQAIATACAGTSVPPEFLAALVANESGGHSTSSRFERHVYLHLLDVQAGKPAQADLLRHRPAHYGAITQADLRTRPENLVRAYATSWGLTQIMGYHAIGSTYTVADLVVDAINLRVAVRLLIGFCRQFSLQPDVEFEEMFRCWNTGSPRGKTFDPQYVENGLRRLVIYREMSGEAQHPPVTDVASGDL